MKKKNLVKYSVIAMTTIGVAGGLGAYAFNDVYAQDTTAVATTYSLIVTNLAEKFGLNEADVQAVFDETKEEREVIRLDEAVSEGTITEDQKALILAKREEFEVKVEEINSQSLTADTRREAIQILRDEIKTWADENDIPAGMVMGGGMGGRGMRGDMGEGMGDFDGGMGPEFNMTE